MKKLKIKKLLPAAKMPTRTNPTDAGLDLYAHICEWHMQPNTIIWPQETKAIQTGIAVEIPPGYYGQIASKAGLAMNCHFVVFSGVIDSGYHGQISVILHNISERAQIIERGDNIAQLIILPCLLLEPIEAELSEIERGSQGFWSAGK